jgi:membrane protein
LGRGVAVKRWAVNVYRARIVQQVVRQMDHQRALQVAGALAYQTILSMVPLIIVGFSLLHVFVGDGGSTELLGYLLQYLIPVETAKVSEVLKGLPSMASPQTVGAVGVFSLLLLVTTLLSNVEGAMNQVWRVGQSRSFVARFTIYYTTLTLAPLLLSVGLYQASQVTEASGLPARSLPWALSFFAFSLCYKSLPQAKTRWRPSFVGGVLAASLFWTAKWGFSLYVGYVASSTYANLYGTLGILPLFLLWIYVCWVVFLLGGQVAYTVQHFVLLAELDRQQDPERRSEELFDQTGDDAAVRLFYEIAAAFQHGKTPPDEEELALSIPMPALAVHFLVERFLQRGLLRALAGGGLVPARPLHELRVFDLVDGLRAPRVPLDLDTMPAPLRTALVELRQGRAAALGTLSFGSLTEACLRAEAASLAPVAPVGPSLPKKARSR